MTHLRTRALLLAAAFIPLTTLAQQPTPQPLTFGVVSIKPHSQGAGWRLWPTPDGYTGSNISLYKLVQEAYGDDHRSRDPKLVTGGPSWIDTDKFDLEAKFDPADIPKVKDLTYRQEADMLRAVLADRFHLKVHFETRDFPVFNLVVARNGLKMQQSKPVASAGPLANACSVRSKSGSPYSLAASNCPIDGLSARLRYVIDHIVIDKTGLTARYDFELEWSPDNTPADSPAAVHPSIFTAVQEQLGLKLEPATAPLQVLVIDSAEKPTPN
jgi:uncharacterized protein (TIGR03435 family)